MQTRQTMDLDIGSYGVNQNIPLNPCEDDCVGSPPPFIEGIVVSRIKDERVYVCSWIINSHFKGPQTLRQFEEAKHTQDFDFNFSGERELQEDERLNGEDPILKEKLRKKLILSQKTESNIDKLKQVFRKKINL